MREIKFRAFYKPDKKIYDVTMIAFIHSQVALQKPTPHIVRLSDVVLLQYIGLEDMNGIEIYEGDIVEVAERSKCCDKPKYTYLADIIYTDHGFFRKHFDDLLTGFGNIENEEIKVIGNIYTDEQSTT